MRKISIILVAVLYVLPILLVGINNDKLSTLTAVVPCLFLLLGLVVVKGREPASYSGFFTPNLAWIYFLIFLYFLGKYEKVFELLLSIKSGEMIQYMISNAVARYEDFESVAESTVIERLATISLLSLGFLIGALERVPKKLVFLLCVLMFIEISDLARLGILIFLIGYLVERVIRGNALIEKKTIGSIVLTLLKYAVAPFALFFIVTILRVANKDNIHLIIIEKVAVYTIAMYEALLKWVEMTDDFGTDLGYNTLTALFKVFGAQAPQGFYLPIDTSFGTTNIYTVIRGFLADYGVVGSSLILFTIGVLVAYSCYKKVNKYQYFVLRLMLFMIFFPLISPLNHFNTLAAFCLSWLIIANSRDSISRYSQIGRNQ